MDSQVRTFHSPSQFPNDHRPPPPGLLFHRPPPPRSSLNRALIISFFFPPISFSLCCSLSTKLSASATFLASIETYRHDLEGFGSPKGAPDIIEVGKGSWIFEIYHQTMNGIISPATSNDGDEDESGSPPLFGENGEGDGEED